jgi:hypothetical protein
VDHVVHYMLGGDTFSLQTILYLTPLEGQYLDSPARGLRPD